MTFVPFQLSLLDHKEDTQGIIRSSNFSEDGNLFVTSSSDDSLHIYQMDTGKLANILHCKKYGSHSPIFNQSGDCLVYASRQSSSDHAIRMHSISENKYVHYFKQHTAPVISLCHVQTTDSFASVGEDLSLCLWDFSSSKLQKQYTFSSPDLPASIVSDPLGLIVSVGTSKGEIHSFDIRMLESGPFNISQCDSDREITSLQFSPCGRFLLGLDSNTNMFVHNSTTFNPLTHPSLTSLSFDSFSFTPDSRFLLCTPPVTDNSPSLSVSLYDIQTWSYVESLPLLADSEIEKISDCLLDVKFNPHKNVISCTYGGNLMFYTAVFEAET